jgi:hypothetical protein
MRKNNRSLQSSINNKKKGKKMELEKKIEIAQQILKQAMEISENTEHDVFFSWSPHVDWIEVCIHRGGWQSNKSGACMSVSFIDKNDTNGELANVLTVLNSLKEDKK